MALRHPIRVVSVALAISILGAACGSSSSGGAMPGMNHPNGTAMTTGAARIVDVTMTDIKFSVAKVDVKVGETVRFVFRNQGKLVHEALIGDAAAQDAHDKQMGSAGGDMSMRDSGAVSVDPGKSGELTHTYNDSGQLLIGCHQPGHYAAGMKINVTVA
jgi:uncharacterized cupredoxin-like copper-binding protein